MNNLKDSLAKENADWAKETGMPWPKPIDPLAVVVSDCPLVQQYVSNRLYFYGGGADKPAAAKWWADEAATNPQELS